MQLLLTVAEEGPGRVSVWTLPLDPPWGSPSVACPLPPLAPSVFCPPLSSPTPTPRRALSLPEQHAGLNSIQGMQPVLSEDGGVWGCRIRSPAKEGSQAGASGVTPLAHRPRGSPIPCDQPQFTQMLTALRPQGRNVGWVAGCGGHRGKLSVGLSLGRGLWAWAGGAFQRGPGKLVLPAPEGWPWPHPDSGSFLT